MDEAQEAEDAKQVIAWAAANKISLSAIQIVIDLGFNSLDSISGIDADNINQGGSKKISIGQQKQILKAVAKLAPPEEGASLATTSANTDHPAQIENPNNGTNPLVIDNDAFQRRLAEHVNMPASSNNGNQVLHNPAPAPGDPPVTGMYSWQDPQVYLKSTLNSKSPCYNIVDFVDTNSSSDEKVVSTDGDFEFICRAGPRKPKLENVTISQWSGANIAILYKLHQDGALGLSGVFDYLSYSSHVYSLVSSYELGSVYLYDREYRKLQAAHKFRWGTAVGHLSAGFLRLRSSVNSHQGAQKSRATFKTDSQRTSYRQYQTHSTDGKTICKNFNSKWGCTFKGCRFDHACSAPNCGKAHPIHAHSHNDTKN